jgi:4'-phosphopantetheinyl transferase
MKSDAIAEPRSSGDAPRPAPGEVHVWRLELPAEGGREAARAALGEILARYLAEDRPAPGAGAGAGGGPPGLTDGPGGKPRLATAPERLAFNLSHSGGLALVALAAGGIEVGIDVERLRPRRDLVRLAGRWLPALDAAAVEAAPEVEREPVFYAAWTRHEARVKCTGAGLGGPPPGPEVVARQLEIDPGYAAAVAVSGQKDAAPAPIFVRRFELGGLDGPPRGSARV